MEPDQGEYGKRAEPITPKFAMAGAVLILRTARFVIYDQIFMSADLFPAQA
jgi:hypothetical protein